MALPGDVSSQFVTALMLVAPATERGIQIELTSPLVSRPYLAITQAVMAAFGVDDVAVGERSVTVGPGRYRRADYRIEPDASSASYLWAAAAITGGRVTVPGFGPAPLQGDAAFVDLLGRMGAGVERVAGSITVHGRAADGIDVDMADWSDTVPTLAAVASFADSPTRIRGIGFIRRKETDRIGVARDRAAAVRGRRDGGGRRPRHPPGSRQPPRRPRPHLRRPPHGHGLRPARPAGATASRSRTPACVAKSFPAYWSALGALHRPG